MSLHGYNTQGTIAVPALTDPVSQDNVFSQVTVESWVKVNAWNTLGAPNDWGSGGIYVADGWSSGWMQTFMADANAWQFSVDGASGGAQITTFAFLTRTCFPPTSGFTWRRFTIPSTRR